jgi:hypothetical protein
LLSLGNFNYCLSRGRRVVESAFGILAGKRRILNKPIETSPEMADRFVKCMCVLHNTVIDRDCLGGITKPRRFIQYQS